MDWALAHPKKYFGRVALQQYVLRLYQIICLSNVFKTCVWVKRNQQQRGAVSFRSCFHLRYLSAQNVFFSVERALETLFVQHKLSLLASFFKNHLSDFRIEYVPLLFQFVCQETRKRHRSFLSWIKILSEIKNAF